MLRRRYRSGARRRFGLGRQAAAAIGMTTPLNGAYAKRRRRAISPYVCYNQLMLTF